MPIYEFQCRRCSRRFETLLPVGAEDRAACPECGGRELSKCVSAFGIGGGADRTAASSKDCSSCSSQSCDTCH